MFYYEILVVLSGQMTDLGPSDARITKVLLDVPLRPNLGWGVGFSSRVLHAQALVSILRSKVEKFPNPI